MLNTMNYATVEQNKINIPSTIKKKLKLHDGDTFEIKESNGNLVLIPKIKTRIRKSLSKKTDLFDMIGVNKNSELNEIQETEESEFMKMIKGITPVKGKYSSEEMVRFLREGKEYLLFDNK